MKDGEDEDDGDDDDSEKSDEEKDLGMLNDEEEKDGLENNLAGLEGDEDVDPDLIILEQEGEDGNDLDEDENEQKDIQQILKEEDITLVPESADISELDKITGVPHRRDTLLFGIPMLAPYSTIQANKYKVKIMPGT